jgi:hypothetical protein
MGTKRIIQRINKTKGWFFEVINKVDRPLSKLTKNKTEKKQINKIRDKNGNITADTSKFQRIIRDYFENLQYNKLEHLEK